MKFGIGLFTKPDKDEYCFFRKYEIQPFQMRWKTDENVAVFCTEPDYSAKESLRQIKRIFVDGNVLSMETEIENTGEREITMEEFCHNFLTIDNLKIGPGISVETFYQIHLKPGDKCKWKRRWIFETGGK